MLSQSHVSRFLAAVLSVALIFTSLSLSDIARADTATPAIIRQLAIPEALGSVTDSYKTDTAPFVVFIQDLHLHYPTQRRILKILDHLYAKNMIAGPIAIEGMQGDYDATALAAFPSGKIKEKLVDYFMQKGELSGDEAFAILRGEGRRLHGVDDSKFYELNRALYKSTLDNRHALESRLSHIQNDLIFLKKRYYNRVLQQLDATEPYDVASGQSLLKEKLDAARALAKEKSPKEAALIRNIIETDHSLYYLKKLLRQETTLEEVRYIAQRLPQFVSLTHTLLDFKQPALKTPVSALRLADLEETLKSAVDFYAVALMRDKPLAENTLKLFQTKPKAVVLVAGGFHTAGVTQALKKAGMGYVVITPHLEEIGQDYHALYEARVADRHITSEEVSHDLEGGIPAPNLSHTSRAEQSLRVVSQLPNRLKPLWDSAGQILRRREDQRHFGGFRRFATPIWASIRARWQRPLSQRSRIILAASLGTALVITGVLLRQPGVSYLGGISFATLFIRIPIVGEFTEIPQSQIPLGFPGLYESYGLRLSHLDITPLKDGPDYAELHSVMEQDGVAGLVGISISQALGAILFAGRGKGSEKALDGNAVFIADQFLRKYVQEHPREAFLIIVDEGMRDGSFSLKQGRMYYHEYPGGSKDFQRDDRTFDHTGLKRERERLSERGVRVNNFAGDAVDGTKLLADPKSSEESRIPTNSFSVAASFDEANEFVPDESRIGGITYYAPEDAHLSPFDLPSVALPKIARAHGLVPDSPEYIEFMNHTRIVMLGPRANKKEGDPEIHRHQAMIDDATTLWSSYRGLQILTPSDGDPMHRMVAGLGLYLDGYRTIVFGRSGAAEATATLIPVINNRNGRFTHTYVSKEATNEVYNREQAYQYSHEEIADFQRLGIPEHAYLAPRDENRIHGRGVSAPTSISGAAPDMFGPTLARLMPRIQFIPQGIGNGGIVVLHTLLVTRNGNAFVLRTTLASDDLPMSRRKLMTASKVARDYLEKQPPSGAVLQSPVHGVWARIAWPAVWLDVWGSYWNARRMGFSPRTPVFLDYEATLEVPELGDDFPAMWKDFRFFILFPTFWIGAVIAGFLMNSHYTLLFSWPGALGASLVVPLQYILTKDMGSRDRLTILRNVIVAEGMAAIIAITGWTSPQSIPLVLTSFFLHFILFQSLIMAIHYLWGWRLLAKPGEEGNELYRARHFIKGRFPSWKSLLGKVMSGLIPTTGRLMAFLTVGLGSAIWAVSQSSADPLETSREMIKPVVALSSSFLSVPHMLLIMGAALLGLTVFAGRLFLKDFIEFRKKHFETENMRREAESVGAQLSVTQLPDLNATNNTATPPSMSLLKALLDIIQNKRDQILAARLFAQKNRDIYQRYVEKSA